MRHAKFSPSSMYRVIACPASWKVSQQMPKQKSSVYAQHGTILHDTVYDVYTGKIAGYKALPVEDRNHVDDVFDFIGILKSSLKGDWVEDHESRVKLVGYGKEFWDVWGTLDYSLLDLENRIYHIADWKFGQGVQVFAHKNEQLMIYAAGRLVGLPPADEIHVHIVQPPLNHFDTYSFNQKVLDEFIFDTLRNAITNAQSDTPEFNPGEKQCRFCPAKERCPARHAASLQAAKDIFKAVNDLEVCTDEEISFLLHRAKDITNHIKTLQAYAMERGLQGKNIPGWKLVQGRTSRSWTDEKAAADYMLDYIDDCYTTNIISPAQAEKKARVLKKDSNFQDLITKKAGKPILVPESDRRASLTIDPFKNVED